MSEASVDQLNLKAIFSSFTTSVISFVRSFMFFSSGPLKLHSLSVAPTCLIRVIEIVSVLTNRCAAAATSGAAVEEPTSVLYQVVAERPVNEAPLCAFACRYIGVGVPVNHVDCDCYYGGLTVTFDSFFFGVGGRPYERKLISLSGLSS
jgi:hypothetical protein